MYPTLPRITAPLGTMFALQWHSSLLGAATSSDRAHSAFALILCLPSWLQIYLRGDDVPSTLGTTVSSAQTLSSLRRTTHSFDCQLFLILRTKIGSSQLSTNHIQHRKSVDGAHTVAVELVILSRQQHIQLFAEGTLIGCLSGRFWYTGSYLNGNLLLCKFEVLHVRAYSF
jgi:hypothetical protein